ncbi:hypothetical protein L1987_56136 [Smallanthus sonchifolius]|uniref:Uncharacterized protein n=1 Tax=Smallanthus sonchifolius TaxID=185202 RepID=A0ACB9EC18_9ASTR|nr:hypothetical protein L1987_56136 [Smallanthus sonchifolius]
MGYLSHRVDPDQVKPGDHIYTWRTAFTYSHHGIYVGENKVVHFTAPETASSGSGWNLCSSVPSACLNSIQIGQNCDLGSPLSTCECGVHQSESGVLVSCLTHFIGTGSLYLYQYGVSKLVYVSKLRGGTCTTAPSDPPQDVIDRANSLLKNGFGAYNVLHNSTSSVTQSEIKMGYLSHQVNPDQLKPGDHIYTWRTTFTYSHHGIYVGENKVIHFTAPETASSGSCTGTGWNLSSGFPSSCMNFIDGGSSQPKSGSQSCDRGTTVRISLCTARRAFWLLESPLLEAAGSTTGAVTVAVTVGTHCWNRYSTDVGVRDDVDKIHVERVGSILGN